MRLWSDPPADRDPAHGGRGMDDDLRRLWKRFQADLAARVETLEATIVALQEGRLDESLRRQAERDAHRLAGSAGMFGQPQASEVARALEALFAGADPIPKSAVPGIRRQVAALRDALAREPARSTAPDRPLALIVHRDPELSAAIGQAAQAQGLAACVSDSIAGARRALSATHPAAALVDLGLERTDVLDFVAALTMKTPPAVVLALTDGAGLVDRVDAVRAGVRNFLPSSLSPAELAGAIVASLEAAQGDRWRVLAVDDDPSVLAVLETLLAPVGVVVTGVTDPEHFWALLGEAPPDMVIVDLDMPDVNGLELCRVLRADPRWATLPVVLVTARLGHDAIAEVFAAGADDYVAKPLIGRELITRITNRLERTRILRTLAETDPLTGLANRRKFEAQWNRLRAMAERYGQPLSFALLDVDRFRDINNSYGHDVGDVVLQRIGKLLLEQFRGEDVVARWGGEEIALALYGMTRPNGVRRVTEALDAVSSTDMEAPDGQRFRVSFSAGVSEYGVDGTTLRELCRRADESLYRAKAHGRQRVLPAGP